MTHLRNFDPARLLLVVPVYNHSGTLRSVVERILDVSSNVLVVDDGSDQPVAALLEGLPIQVIRHETNQGKGAAVLSAAEFAREHGYSHIMTLDADGQHDPADAFHFFPLLAREPDAIIVGSRDFSGENVPGSSRFGRKFSNFWLRVQTGVILDDVQSGFRVYPVEVLHTLRFRERRYSFEVEVLAKAAWAGFPLREVDISVHYPPREERISHFRKLYDNVLISLLNTRLTIRSFLPVPHRQYCRDASGDISAIHPVHSLKLLLAQNNTPATLGMATGLGILLGALPLIGLHCLAIVLIVGYLRLSKVAALAVSHLCAPPLVPALCIEIGYFLRHGSWLTELSLRTIGYEAPQRFLEWALGSLVVGPLAGVMVGAVVFVAAKLVQVRLRRTARAAGGDA